MKIIKGDDVQCVLPWKAYVGECPVWNPEEQKLYWVDILKKKIHRFNPETRNNETFELPEIVPCIGLRAKGGLVLTMKKNFAFFDPETNHLEKMTSVESDVPNNRFNDGKCDPQGRFWAGTMDAVHWDQPVGNLFRFDSSYRATLMQDKVICANGSGWSPDSKTMYFTESFRYEIFAYDFEPETGEISRRRIFAKIDKSHGAFPDGMTVDSEGFVWSNILKIGQIHRFDPDGNLERIIQFPVPRATGCAFGNKDLKTLYVTSSYETMSPAEIEKAPLSGSLFAIATGIAGLPSPKFKG